MADKKANDFNSLLGTLEKTLNEYLGQKAPQLPKAWKEIIVKFAPYLAVIGVILSIPAILALFGLGTMLAPLGMMGAVAAGRPFLGAGYIISIVFLVIVLILEAMAIPGLFNRTKPGWTYLYYATLVGAIQNIITFNIGGLLIGTLLGLYILFQVKEYYK